MVNWLKKVKYRLLRMYIVNKSYLSRKSKYDGIIIRGSHNFGKKIVSALELLKNKLPKEYFLVQDNVKQIVEAISTTAYANRLLPTLTVGYKNCSEESMEELAKLIAHEAYHCFLFNEYLRKDPDRKQVPKHIYSGERAERQCLTYAIFEVGKWLGLDKDLEEEFKEAMDSRWWEKPYWERIGW